MTKILVSGQTFNSKRQDVKLLGFLEAETEKLLWMQVAEVFQQNVDLSDSCVAAKQEVRVSKRLTHKPDVNARWFGRTFKQKS